MKSMTVLSKNFLFAMLLVLGFATALAAEPTALDLIKEANRHVGADVKDKVVQIRSEKSVASLQPNIWFVVYYDKDATFKTAEVKLAAGKKLEVKHPMRQPFAYLSYKDLLDLKKISIDSDKAIRIATAEPLLEKLTIKATQLELERKDNLPVWRVKLWAAKLRDERRDANIGDVLINAEDGSVIESNLKINRVD